jgi:hypothetical protein
MAAASIGEVLVVLASLAIVAAAYGAERRRRKRAQPRRGGRYREIRAGERAPDPWRAYRWAKWLTWLLPVAIVFALVRIPLRFVAVLGALAWLGALLVVAGYRCPRCRRGFGGSSAKQCRYCGLPRYEIPTAGL